MVFPSKKANKIHIFTKAQNSNLNIYLIDLAVLIYSFVFILIYDPSNVADMSFISKIAKFKKTKNVNLLFLVLHVQNFLPFVLFYEKLQHFLKTVTKK